MFMIEKKIPITRANWLMKQELKGEKWGQRNVMYLENMLTNRFLMMPNAKKSSTYPMFSTSKS